MELQPLKEEKTKEETTHEEEKEKHFQVVWDKSQVERFAEIILSRLIGTNACICVFLFARRKYDEKLPQSEYILKRLFFSDGKTPDVFYRDLLKLHVPYGSYSPPEISQKSLCMYALLRPKDQLRPMSEIFNKCIQSFTTKQEIPKNLLNRYMEEIGKCDYNIPKTKENSVWVQIDLDTKDVEFLKNFQHLLEKTNIDKHIVFTVETKNGFHIVFEKTEECDLKLFHEERMKSKTQKINKNGKKFDDYAFNTTNEPNVIIPGTFQGGYPASFSTTWFCGKK